MSTNKTLLKFYLQTLSQSRLLTLLEDALNALDILNNNQIDNYINNIITFDNINKSTNVSNIKELAAKSVYNPNDVDYDSIKLATVSHIIGVAQYSYTRKNSNYKESFRIYLNDDNVELQN